MGPNLKLFIICTFSIRLINSYELIYKPTVVDYFHPILIKTWISNIHCASWATIKRSYFVFRQNNMGNANLDLE